MLQVVLSHEKLSQFPILKQGDLAAIGKMDGELAFTVHVDRLDIGHTFSAKRGEGRRREVPQILALRGV